MEPKYIGLLLLLPLICLVFCVDALNTSVDRRIGLTGLGPLVSPKRMLAFSRILSGALLIFGFGVFLWNGDPWGCAVAAGGIALGSAHRALVRIDQRLDEWVSQANASASNKAPGRTIEDSRR
ncbi:MAG TPA: hypothetical protein VGD45_16915 [Steroidobacter sp.]|uniref:hypothetical protein n=1 Tax=Steroidobacter sp. TaxID=1978227 RepID=UPI002ED851CE